MLSSSKPTYDSIPSSKTNSGASSEGLSSKRKLVIAFAIVLLAGIFFGGTSNRDERIATPASLLGWGWGWGWGDDPVNFPKMIAKAGIGTPTSPATMPVTTKEALESKDGWTKVDEPCNEKLGEAWRIGDEHSKDSIMTLYFTPQVGDSPGYLSAIEADYYDYVEENLVGTYFKPSEVSKDGVYWSIAVLVRKPTEQGLCDTSEHVGIQEEPYFAVAPELINNVYPINSNDPDIKNRFVEGMCSKGMGYHWFSDVVGGPKLTYKPENLNPVTPMYNSVTGDFQAFYFIATDVLKRNFPAKECGGYGLEAMECGFSKPEYANMWDAVVPGMFTKNAAPFFMCSQFCDPDCQFTGGRDFPDLGVAPGFMTMHVFFDRSDECDGPKGMKENPHYPPPIDDFLCRDPDSYPSYAP